jgi:hypothetical protein
MGCHTWGMLALGIVLQRHGCLACLVRLAVPVGSANTVKSDHVKVVKKAQDVNYCYEYNFPAADTLEKQAIECHTNTLSLVATWSLARDTVEFIVYPDDIHEYQNLSFHNDYTLGTS